MKTNNESYHTQTERLKKCVFLVKKMALKYFVKKELKIACSFLYKGCKTQTTQNISEILRLGNILGL